MREYQPNSHRSKEMQATEETQPVKKIEKVVTGKVKTRDNKGRKLLDTFISEDASKVKDTIVMDIIVPTAKKVVSEIITTAVDIVLYGGSREKRSGSTSKVSYRSYYNERDRFSDRRDSDSYSTRGQFRYEDIVFETRGDAEAVRRQMLDAVRKYGMVTVADMYDMAGETAPYTSCDYGWMGARIFETAEPRRVRDGYVIPLPNASPID